MYRTMTAEEKLAFSSEMIEAIKKDGLLGSLEVVEKYKQLLSQHDIVEPPLEENILPDEVSIKETHQQNTSIYAAEHISAVQEDLRQKEEVHKENQEIMLEQPKTRVLEPIKNSTPNPWGESKVVLPGELNL